MSNPSSEWFTSWFGSPYYPILYQKRDHKEAYQFIDALLNELSLPSASKVLDLACGRGRHAQFLAQHPLKVWGMDISKESIEEAKQLEQENLHFLVHDMRVPYPQSQFKAVFNLFTSFGYFANLEENNLALRNIYDALLPSGILVLDYLNVNWVRQHRVHYEEKVLQGIEFAIRRYEGQGRIYKAIDVRHENELFHFKEQVQALSVRQFQRMLGAAGFVIDHLWGDYYGNRFDINLSPRLIIFATKTVI